MSVRDDTLMNTFRNAMTSSATAVGRWVLASVIICVALTGCAAFHPIRGVPAPYVPHEYLGPSRSGKKTIDLSLLVQTPPDQYRVAAGDTLSIFIPGVLGSLNIEEDRQIGETPPINLSSNPADPPTIGYPITVRDNGTIALPYVDPINVHGMTLPDIEIAIRRAYTQESDILNGERDRVLVSLQRRREVSVIVVRQETSSELTQGAQAGTLNIGFSKRGTARTVRLPAYENDVLHALANSQQGSDGLPGLDAKNTIYIIRRKRSPLRDSFVNGQQLMPPQFPFGPADYPPMNNGAAPPLQATPYPAQPQPQTDYGIAPTPYQQPATLPQPQPTMTPPSIPAQRDTAPEPVVPQSPQIPPPTEESPLRALPPDPIDTTPQPALESEPTKNPATPVNPPQNPIPSDVPVWPAPAQPSTSIQRTSGPAGNNQTQAVWPAIRSQSPNNWIWGHSNYSMEQPPIRTGQMPLQVNPIPYPGSTEATFSPGTQMPPATSSWTQPPVASTGPYQQYPPMPFAPGYGPTHSFGGHDNSWQAAMAGFDPTVDNPNVIKIPIRLAEGERPTFTERDIILEDGDIVFIESRETEVFYTGGLLGGGQYTLPRDYDLRVLEAISIAQSPQNNIQPTGRAIGGVSSLNQDVTISASHVVILRTLPNGTRIPIEVDLYKAVRRPEENLLIQPGDLIILQYTKIEAVGAFIERHLLEGALFGVAAAQLSTQNGNN